MSWKVSNVIEQRKLFIDAARRGEEYITDLCEEFGISRSTGYKWIRRYMEEGDEGLKDRSSARHTQADKTEQVVEDKILEVKDRYPTWGPKKILAYLARHNPEYEFPSFTTIGNILDRNGRVRRRKKRKRLPTKTDPLSHCKAANDVWCIDFKGWFTTKDRVKCDPLTITDAFSRYILHCSKLHSGKGADVWRTLEELFCNNGLPLYLRHDNGPPFATTGAGRLSALSVKLIKAGVTPEWLDPGKPYQNGRHERMHGTLQQEAVFPLKLTLEEQQMKFRDFIHYFNHVRPHEGISQKVPADIYIRSERQWDGKLRSPEYGKEYTVKQVRRGGQIGWCGRDIFIGKALCEEPIGIKEGDDGETLVYYGPVYLGQVDHLGQFIMPRPSARTKRNYHVRCY